MPSPETTIGSSHAAGFEIGRIVGVMKRSDPVTTTRALRLRLKSAISKGSVTEMTKIEQDEFPGVPYAKTTYSHSFAWTHRS